jgi:hypothetical protein
MTEEVTGTNQSIDTSKASAAVETHKSESAERTFRQSEVNELIGREKHEAVERYKRQNEQERQPQQSAQQPPSYQSQGGFTETDLRRMAAEEAQRLHETKQQDYERQQMENQVVEVAKEFSTKMTAGKEKYQDFDTVMGKIKVDKYGNVAYMATRGLDNTADVMYHLAKNPMIMAEIERTSREDPDLAYYEMQRISQSIKDNESASNIKVPRPPLSQLSPSNTGTDNGAMSVKDFRQKYKV